MVGTRGFEPLTSSVSRKRSPTELRAYREYKITFYPLSLSTRQLPVIRFQMRCGSSSFRAHPIYLVVSRTWIASAVGVIGQKIECSIRAFNHISQPPEFSVVIVGRKPS